MCCTLPLSCLVKINSSVIPASTSDNEKPQIPTSTSSSEPHTMWYMDVGNRPRLRAAMFCSETLSLQSVCTHDREEDLSFES